MGMDTSGGSSPDVGDTVNNSGWLGIDAPTVANTPGELSTATGASPAAVSTSDEGNQVTTGDAAGEHASLYTFSDANLGGATKILLGVMGFHRQTLGTASTDFPLIGMFDASAPASGDNNIAVFDMTAGDDTAGNVRVDNGGTDNDGQLNYPTVTEPNYYEVVIDTGALETRFYSNSSEINDDNPDITISATPALGNDRQLGVGAVGSNNSVFHCLHIRTLYRLL